MKNNVFLPVYVTVRRFLHKNYKNPACIFLCILSILLCTLIVQICPGSFPGVYRTELLSLEKSVKSYFIIQEDKNVYGAIVSKEGTRIVLVGNWEKQGRIFILNNNMTHEKLKFEVFLWGMKWINPPLETSFPTFIYSFRKPFGKKEFQDKIPHQTSEAIP